MIGKTVRDVTIQPLIVGDSAFPLRSWLLKPYTNAVLTPQQHYFNYPAPHCWRLHFPFGLGY